MESFALIDEGNAVDLQAVVVDGRVAVSTQSLETALGWTLKPEGLCRGEVCVPVREPGDLLNSRGIDLAAFARVLGRPLALDPENRAAALGTSSSERGAQLASLEAPDFTLPDLQGKLHSLSDHRGKKVLLVAYASW